MANIRRSLIYLISENARVKIKESASLFQKSSQRVKYSLKAMEKEEIIYHPYCIFDYSYFGLLLFRVYFKGAYIGEKDKSDIIKKLTENEYVVSIYELSGEFDLVIEIEAPNPSRFNKVLKNISHQFPTLKHYKIILNLVTHLYPKTYLIGEEIIHSQISPHIIIGGDRNREWFNEKEMTIMKQLLLHPKIRVTTLAKQADLNIKTVKSTLKTLYQKNIIRGYKYIINADKLEIYKFRLFLKIHNLTQIREEELKEYLLKTKEIVQANKTVGDWDLEVDIEALDKIRIRTLTIEIREQFKDIIETFNIMEFYQYYTKFYLPSYLFQNSEEIIPK